MSQLIKEIQLLSCAEWYLVFKKFAEAHFYLKSDPVLDSGKHIGSACLSFSIQHRLSDWLW